ncbi:MAG: hypothetical protein U1F43_00510 [Myxococcota bacterium]
MTSAPSSSPAVPATATQPISITGAVGAIFLPIMLALAVQFYLESDEILGLPMYVMLLVGLAYILVSTGMFALGGKGGGGFASTIGGFHIATALAWVVPSILIMKTRSEGFDKGTVAILFIAMHGLAAITWILSGIWGLTARRAVGTPLAIAHGILALLGGLGLAATIFAVVSNTIHREAFGTFFGASIGVIAASSITLAVALLRKPR